MATKINISAFCPGDPHGYRSMQKLKLSNSLKMGPNRFSYFDYLQHLKKGNRRQIATLFLGLESFI